MSAQDPQSPGIRLTSLGVWVCEEAQRRAEARGVLTWEDFVDEVMDEVQEDRRARERARRELEEEHRWPR